MKKLFSVMLVILTVLLVGCGKGKTLPTITRQEAQIKLTELSTGFDVYYDDMKEFTVVRCHYNSDDNSKIVPYVIIYDKDYSASLRYHILYSGVEPLHFDTLYIKTPEGIKTFEYEDVTVLYGSLVVEEYNGKMSKEVYDVLKAAINTGYAKIRLEGRQMDERELTQEELDDFAKLFSLYEYFNSVKVD